MYMTTKRNWSNFAKNAHAGFFVNLTLAEYIEFNLIVIGMSINIMQIKINIQANKTNTNFNNIYILHSTPLMVTFESCNL